MKGPREGVGFLVPVVAFVALFALLPVALLFANALVQVGGTSGFLSVVTTARNLRSLDNSLEQGALSATLAVGLGYPAGVFVGRYSFRGRSLLRSLLLVPFLLPSLVVVLGVLDLFGPSGVISTVLPFTAWFGSGIPAIIAANLFFNVPIVLLLTATGCEGASVELEETVATLGGSPLRAYREVWARPTWVGAAAGGLLTFLFSALSFAPPLLLCGASARCYTLEAQVYALDQTFLDPNAAAVLALAMVLLLLLPTAVYLALVSRLRANPGRRSASPRPIDWRAPACWALALETTLVLLAEGALLAAVLYRTVAPTGHYGAGAAWAALFSSSTTDHLGVSALGALGNTLFFAVVAALLALLLSVASGYAVVRRHRHERLDAGDREPGDPGAPVRPSEPRDPACGALRGRPGHRSYARGDVVRRLPGRRPPPGPGRARDRRAVRLRVRSRRVHRDEFPRSSPAHDPARRALCALRGSALPRRRRGGGPSAPAQPRRLRRDHGRRSSCRALGRSSRCGT